MKKLYILLFCLLIGFPSLAGWEVAEEVDSMTDEIKKFVVIRNDDGHDFFLYIGPKKRIWANFSLSDKSLNQIDSKGLMIVRIDKNEPINIQKRRADVLMAKRHPEIPVLKELVFLAFDYEWNPKWVNFVIEREDFKTIVQGKKLLVRYYLPAGGYKETSFMIEGGEDAIRQVIDIGV